MKKDSLASSECFALMAYCILAGFFVSSPLNPFTIAGNAAWLSVLLGGVVALVVFLMLERGIRGRGLIEIGQLGIGRPVLFLLGMVMLLCAASAFRSTLDACEIYALPETKSLYVGIAVILAVGIVSYTGISPLGRAMQLSLPVALVILLTVIVLAPKYQFNLAATLPIYGNGPTYVARGSAGTGMAYLCMLFPLFEMGKYKGSRLQAGGRAILLICIVVTLFYFVGVMVYPNHSTDEVYNLMLDLASESDAGRYMHRLCAPFILVWLMSLLAAASAFVHFCARALSSALHTKKHTMVITLVLVAVFALGIFPREMLPGWINLLVDLRDPKLLLLYVPAVLLIFIGMIRNRRQAHA